MRIKSYVSICLFFGFLLCAIALQWAPATASIALVETPIVKSKPDLVVRTLASAQAAGCFDVPQTLVTVGNLGNASAEEFRISLNGEMIIRVQNLAPGHIVTLTFPFYTDALTTAVVDSTNVVVESNENNNSLSAVLPYPAPGPTCTPQPTCTPAPDLPDIIVTDIIPAAAAEGCGDNPRTLVQITNQGSVSAGLFLVSLSSMNITHGQQVQTLGPGQSIMLSFDFFTDATMNAVGDSTNVVVESNESNNTRSEILPYPAPNLCTPVPASTVTPSPTLPANPPTN